MAIAANTEIKPRSRVERKVFRELLLLGTYLSRAQHSAQPHLVQQYQQMIEVRCEVLSGLRP